MILINQSYAINLGHNGLVMLKVKHDWVAHNGGQKLKVESPLEIHISNIFQSQWNL
jgi:hypothetical protein